MRIIGFAAVVWLLAGGGLFADSFAYTGGVQQYTVPITGIYSIVGYGASGGAGHDFSGGTNGGGQGAGIGGDFLLTAGAIIDLYVAQQGGNGAGADTDGGGGGGTFIVVDGTNLPLLVAAGGGGGGSASFFSPTNGGLTTSGGTGLGGSGGFGGGGGGFLGSGQNGGAGKGGAGFPTLTGGIADVSADGNGGYGGGGTEGGGGGGYTGGNGGCCSTAGGQGGSSYLETGVTATILTTNSGNGSASITLVAAVPEPASWVLLAPLAAVLMARKRRS